MLEEDKGYILYVHTEEGETYEVSVAKGLSGRYEGIRVPSAYRDKFNKAVSDYERYCVEIKSLHLSGITSESLQDIIRLSDKANTAQKCILTIPYMCLKEEERQGYGV